MKYKVGDKVRIKSLDWYNENKDCTGCLVCGDSHINSDMECMLGEIVTIIAIEGNHYRIKEYGWNWTDEMIEGLVEEESKPEPKFKVGDRVFNLATKKSVNIIEWDEETGLYIVRYDDGVRGRSLESELKRLEHITLDDVKDETNPKDMGEVSDGYHTFNELYEYRMLYNAALFNEFAKQGLYDVHKSRKHSDGEYPFGDPNWFIVMAELPTGQISNHYEMKDWDLFDIPEKETANKWDGHTPKDVTERLRRFLTPKSKYPQTYEECCKVLGYSGNYNMILTTDVDNKLFNALYRLKVCRDAYWKLYGEEMGLGKPWEPDWNNPYTTKWTIVTGEKVRIVRGNTRSYHSTFAFPTEEIRDAFYETFNDLIESCKELL